MAREKKEKEKNGLSKKIVRFLLKPHDLRQMADYLKMSLPETEEFLKSDFGEYELDQKQNPVFGHNIYFLRRKIEIVKQDRIWNFLRHETKPYIVIKFPPDLKWKKILLIPISDVDFGSSLCDVQLFDEYLKWLLSEPHAFAFLNGDILAPVPVKGFPKDEYDPLLYAYELVKKLMPVAHKILWAQQGDKEEKVDNNCGLDPLEFVSNGLGIPYFKEPVYADVCWNGDHIFTFYCFHGRTAAILKGSKLNAALRPREFQQFTMFTVMGHSGDGMVKEMVRFCPDPYGFQLVPKDEYYIVCPSFKSYWGSNLAKKGQPPLSTGTISCRLYRNGQYNVSS